MVALHESQRISSTSGPWGERPHYMHLVPVPGGQVLCWVMQYLLKVREEIHVASSLGLLLWKNHNPGRNKVSQCLFQLTGDQTGWTTHEPSAGVTQSIYSSTAPQFELLWLDLSIFSFSLCQLWWCLMWWVIIKADCLHQQIIQINILFIKDRKQ